MKEIGGYFGLENSVGKGEYYSTLIALNTARNALVYIIKAQNIKKIYIPFYLCSSVSLVLEREKIEFEYYNIDYNFHPIFEKTVYKDERLYIVNYYGQLSNDDIIAFEEKYKNIIIDNVQAFFQKPINSIDTIYSCRKFFGVPDGAYLNTSIEYNRNIAIDDSSHRLSHIYGRVKDGAAAHYDEFKKNDASFRELELKKMSKITHNLLHNINYLEVKRIRERNYKILFEAFEGINMLKIRKVEGPYAYPLYLKKGMEYKKKLADKKIYVSTLWPNIIEENTGIEKEFAENILPIPCDQRYDEDDMRYIIGSIMKLLQDGEC